MYLFFYQLFCETYQLINSLLAMTISTLNFGMQFRRFRIYQVIYEFFKSKAEIKEHLQKPTHKVLSIYYWPITC